MTDKLPAVEILELKGNLELSENRLLTFKSMKRKGTKVWITWEKK